MKAVLLFLAAVFVVAKCNHLFLGSNVNRPMLYHVNYQKNSQVFRKRVEYFHYQVPNVQFGSPPRVIQGILAVDLKGSKASANVTNGGIGYTYTDIRMKSERGKGLHYDIYIFA